MALVSPCSCRWCRTYPDSALIQRLVVNPATHPGTGEGSFPAPEGAEGGRADG